MNAADRERVKSLLAQAAKRPPADRKAFIETSAADAPAIMAEALDLLPSLDDGFMASPTGGGLSPPPEPPAASGPGETIGRYKLLRRLGAGGMGEVYLAQQQEPIRRQVALKVIKLGMDTREVVARFESERQALALMNHVNVAAVYDGGVTAQGRPYFVMEHVPGEPITAYCNKNRLTIPQRLHLFMQVCHAVQHAHTKGIIHRDIKPSNVLVMPESAEVRKHESPQAASSKAAAVVKVIDFGVAKATNQRLTERSVFTELGQLVGTPEYMSPEQAEMSQLDIDTRTDIYSLGVLLYELLTGTLPFDAASLRRAGLAEIQRLIREVDPPRPSTRMSGLAEPAHRPVSGVQIADARQTDPRTLHRLLRGDLDWVVMKCIEKDRSRRYPTANALALDIQRYLNQETVLARPPSTAYRVSKFVRRNRAGVLAGATLAIALIGATGVSFWFAASESHQRRLADAAKNEAEKRQRELQQVADFQAQMLGDLDAEAMGRGIKSLYRDQVATALARESIGEWPNRRKRTSEETAAELAAFDQRAAPAQAADVARGVMDEFVLKRAAVALTKQFGDQPLVQAQIRRAIGETYRSLGLYDAAERQFREALLLRRAALGNDSREVSESALQLASLLRELGNYEAAEPLYREAVALDRKLRGDRHPETGSGLNGLGLLLFEKGDYAAAEPLFRESLALAKVAPPTGKPDVELCLHNLARVMQAKGDLAAAEPLFREALTLYRARPADQQDDLSTMINNLALLLHAKGDLDAAEPLYREALAIDRRRLGNEHPKIGNVLNNLAALRADKGDITEAEVLYRETLALDRKLLGDDHPNIALDLNNLAVLLQGAQRLDAAEPLHREALALHRKLLGDDHPTVAANLYNLGVLLDHKDQFVEAEQRFRESLVIREKRLPAGHPDTAASRAQTGLALLGLKRFAEAEPMLLEAWRALSALPNAPNRYKQSALKGLMRLYDEWHKAEPDQGHDARKAEWQHRLTQWQATTQPAAQPTASGPAEGPA